MSLRTMHFSLENDGHEEDVDNLSENLGNNDFADEVSEDEEVDECDDDQDNDDLTEENS